jgi:uncharacterized protein (TIGR02680 family)
MIQQTNGGLAAKNVNEVILPETKSCRWQPIRGALLNLYRFDYEEFRYEEGRLLLRGNNGTGKSRVLALQLPFLLDGEIASHRLEPDGDPAKRMEWNLLLGKYPDRLGYTWIEFGRQDDEGNAHYLTLGCGLNAVEGRGIHSKWFFITDQRIGRDLFLATAGGQPLGKSRLEAAIEGHGELFSSAEAYRRAVDRALFKLGDRYEALVELLIRLRQPKLSRTLDEKQLSDALSEALPPISSNVLADVAEAFGTLETDRRQLEDFKTARDGVEAFLAEYRVYVQIAARRRAEHVRKAHSEYESTQRRLRKAEINHEQATAELRLVEARIAKLKEDDRAASEAVQTLASSPQMRDAEALDESRRQADERQSEAQRANKEYQNAIAVRVQLDSESESAKKAEDSAWKNTDRVLTQSHAGAELTGLATNHQAAIDLLGLPELASAKAIDTSENAIKACVRKHQAAIQHVRQANQVVQAARQDLTAAKATYTHLETQLTEATENQRGIQLASEKAGDRLLSEYREWLGALRELRPADAETVAEQIATWCELGDGDGPIELAVRSAVTTAIQAIAALNADGKFRFSSISEKLLELESEHKDVEAGYHQPPPAPHTRNDDFRAARPGAPLWALCDFRPGIQAAEQAAIEAALEASGLLDAWVTPDGQLLDLTEHDTVLVSDTSPLPPEDQHLGLALIPCTEGNDERAKAVDPSRVRSVLRHIGLGQDSGAVCVEWSGRWQLGPLHGVWSKAFAQHIGHAAREAERQRRLAELSRVIDEASAIQMAIQRELEALAERAATVAREEATAPSDETIRRLQVEFSTAAKAVAVARLRLTEAESRVEKCRAKLMDSTAARDRDARDLNIAAWVDKLSDLDELLASYRETTAELWPTLRSYLTVRSQSQDAADRSRVAQSDEQHRLALLGEARERAAAAAAKRDALASTKGADAAKVLTELEAARSRLKQTQDQREGANENRVKASERLGGARQEIGLLRETLERNSNDREQAVRILKSFAAVRLLVTAHQDLRQIEIDEWTITRAVEIARTIEATLAHVDSDDVAWDRNQKEIHRYIEELKDSLLPHGHSPVTTNTGEGLFVVTVPFQGREHGMDEFRDALSGEIDHHQLVLDAHEREVLENHLVGEVAIHLHDLLHNAEKLVRDMNDELISRPTSTGMKLRFSWDPIDDGPPGLLEARRRLLGTGGTWSPAERAALGDFLQERIREIRAANQTGTWYEHLSEALDYRKWHQFGVDRQQDGHWRRLNRRTYGTGSGGEKAIALTIPQFAAAAAHYRSADPLAPRLILLDEAFAGIDSDMRSKCMGLLHAFDLDYMMTSELEWGCYPTVPALAIYQLATLPGVDAVGVTRWVWNGRERLPDDQSPPGPFAPETPTQSEYANGNSEATIGFSKD